MRSNPKTAPVVTTIAATAAIVTSLLVGLNALIVFQLAPLHKELDALRQQRAVDAADISALGKLVNELRIRSAVLEDRVLRRPSS